jgi:hypothetical protein
MAKGTRSRLPKLGQALEAAFFESADPHAYFELRRSEQAAEARLANASGITDRALLLRLAGAGVRAETLAALVLIPLVQVAWADGKMDARESKAVLSGAESTGIDPKSPSHRLLRLWLEDRPAPDLMQLWGEFIGALCEQLSDHERQQLRKNLLGRARSVAEAAGALLGLGDPVSREEARVLDQLSRAFESAQ